MKSLLKSFYGFYSIILIEVGNFFSDILYGLNQLSINVIEILQLLIAILTIWKLIHELKIKRKQKDETKNKSVTGSYGG